jgi:hypothetical protein
MMYEEIKVKDMKRIEVVPQKDTRTKFFVYNQNNSGGVFVVDSKRGIGEHVIIEATSAKHADSIAQGIGLYFDGKNDCNCCGDRWYSQSEAWFNRDGLDWDEIGFGVWHGNLDEKIYVHWLSGRVDRLEV